MILHVPVLPTDQPSDAFTLRWKLISGQFYHTCILCHLTTDWTVSALLTLIEYNDKIDGSVIVGKWPHITSEIWPFLSLPPSLFLTVNVKYMHVNSQMLHTTLLVLPRVGYPRWTKNAQILSHWNKIYNATLKVRTGFGMLSFFFHMGPPSQNFVNQFFMTFLVNDVALRSYEKCALGSFVKVAPGLVFLDEISILEMRDSC